MNSTCVKPVSTRYAGRISASSRYVRERLFSSGTLRHDPGWSSYTEIGELNAFLLWRSFIHSVSFHAYDTSNTMDAVFGGTSQENAKGSPFAASWLCTRERM